MVSKFASSMLNNGSFNQYQIKVHMGVFAR